MGRVQKTLKGAEKFIFISSFHQEMMTKFSRKLQIKMFISGVSVVLVFIKILSGSQNFWIGVA